MATFSPLGAAHRVARETAHALVTTRPVRNQDPVWDEAAEIVLTAAILRADDPTPANVAGLLRRWATGAGEPPQSLRLMFNRTLLSAVVLALDALPEDAADHDIPV